MILVSKRRSGPEFSLLYSGLTDHHDKTFIDGLLHGQ